MKRQRGRNRSGGGGGGGGGGKPSHNVNRAFDSNGPDNVKIRGHAQHVYEKYQQLARDASASGDRVLAENYLQHAEHYFRVLRSLQPHRPASEIMGRDALASGFDIDFEDEGGAEAPEEGEAGQETAEAGGAPGGEEPRGDRQDQRGEQRQDFRPDNRERRDGPRDGRDNRRFEGRRDDRGYGQREGGRYEPRDDRRPEGRDEPRNGETPREVQPAGEPESAPLGADERGSTVLRSQDGGVSEAPAFLQGPAADDGEARRPRSRSRRRPRSFEPGEGGAPEGGEGDEG